MSQTGSAVMGDGGSVDVDVDHTEPLFLFEHDGLSITVLGTAHVSEASASKVRELVASGEFDAVALELCANRYQSLTDPEAISRLDLLQVIRQGKGAVVMASLALGAFQQRIASQLGVVPGGEMAAAIEAAEPLDLPVVLIDRDIGITLKRTYRNIPLLQRLSLFSGLLGSVVFSGDKVSEKEIEQLKQGDVLESTFSQFSESAPDIYGPLVDERDRYMVARLIEEARRSGYRRILAVVGAGHLKGMAEQLDRYAAAALKDDVAAVQAELSTVAPPSRLIKSIPWLIVAVILGGFGYGFSQSSEVGWQMVQQWVVINGGLAALGAVLALAHPLTVVSAFVAAPLTSLNPAIGAGVVCAAVESWFRKPQMGDFATLKHDTSNVKGWWGNRVARTLLVFLFTGIGSALGTYVAGYKIFESAAMS